MEADAERKKLVDFHFHSTFSDGSENIAGIIEEAKARKVAALALTDHNNGAGVPELVSACKEAGIYSLEGVEIMASFAEHKWSWDTAFCGPVPDVVILGKKLNWNEFRAYQEKLMQYWLEYWIPETLNGLREAGLKVPDLTKDEIWDQLKDFGTPKILHDVPRDTANWAPLLRICESYDPDVTAEDIMSNPVRWANRHLYAIGKKAYVLRAPEDWTVRRAVELANAMNGVLFAAHPGGEYGNWTDKHLDFFVEEGGTGIEVYQYFHSESQMQKFWTFAKEHQLLISGGSDWHGRNGRPTLGCWDKPNNQTPYEVFERLMDSLP